MTASLLQYYLRASKLTAENAIKHQNHLTLIINRQIAIKVSKPSKQIESAKNCFLYAQP